MYGPTLIIIAIVSWLMFFVFGGYVIYEAYHLDSPKFSITIHGVDQADSDTYTCPKAKNVLNGTKCLFKTEKDAVNFCTSDLKCQGYVFDGTHYLATTKIKFSNTPPQYYKSQDSVISPLYPIINKYTTNNNASGNYLCKKAVNLWSDSTNKIDPDWCRFNSPQDAANWCITDTDCHGYVIDKSKKDSDNNVITTYIASTNLTNNNTDQITSYTKTSIGEQPSKNIRTTISIPTITVR